MKIVIAILTTLIALSSLLFNYKDKTTGKLTSKAYFAIFLVLILGTLNIIFEVKQTNKNKEIQQIEESRNKYGEPFPLKVLINNQYKTGELIALGLQNKINNYLETITEITGDDESNMDLIVNDSIKSLISSLNQNSIIEKRFTLSFYNDSSLTNMFLNYEWDSKSFTDRRFYYVPDESDFYETIKTEYLDPNINKSQIINFIDFNKSYLKLEVLFNGLKLDEDEIKKIKTPGLALLCGSRATEISIPLKRISYRADSEKQYKWTYISFSGKINIP